MLDIPHRLARFRQRGLSNKRVKTLQRLQRILFHARAYSLLESRMQIDEQSGAQHSVNFVLSRRVSSHQPFELTWLMGSKMVDMHIGSRVPPPHNLVHYPFESLLLLLRPETPPLFIEQLLFHVRRHKAKQVLPSGIRSKWIAL